jgi:hypothetical protein
MSTFAMPSGSYRAVSLKQAWNLRLQKAGRSVWQALENYGRQRADVHIRQLASQYELTRPELAAQLRQALTPTRIR